MEILEAIRTRRSIRGFKPEPVSKEVLAEILEIACRAPSAMNSQPWEFFVLSGKTLDAVRQRNIQCIRSGMSPEPDHRAMGWPQDSVYRQRQVGLAKQLFQLMGIHREDMAKRMEWMERGFRYFDAPASIVVVSDRRLTETGPLLDIGGVIQNICLAALACGLGTCVEDQGVLYPRILREIAGIPESKRIIMAIAIGYPDWGFPANAVKTEREPLSNLTTWVGFEG